jgi:HD superfamily phosphohydrolase
VGAAGTRIADAVHGTVILDETESAVIGTRAFQRLRGVKHLGLASLTFPGADYSRFSHGVGTRFVMGRILESLELSSPGRVPSEDARAFRMAALLHDVGHFPFSHTFERALVAHYRKANVLQPAGAEPTETASGDLWKHEDMGTHVILEDAEVRDILVSQGIDIDLVTNVIARSENPPKLANLVSSDLDADRTDYLMRTAKHTGLPYGNVDLPYLLSQITLDGEGFIAFHEKGMRAAEHLLLSRYYDYQQVSYHKTVAGMELVLNDAIGVMLREGRFACSGEDLARMIADGSWYGFDDAYIMHHIRERLSQTGSGDQHSVIFESLVRRWPPKMILEKEDLGEPQAYSQLYTALRGVINAKLPEWRARFDVPVYVWDPPAAGLTKIGGKAPISSALALEQDEYDHIQQAIRIVKTDGSTCTIQEHPRSLMRVLADQALFGVRVYALLRPEQEDLRASITAKVHEDLSAFLGS